MKYLQYCSCECGLNKPVLPLIDVDGNQLSCLNCTRQFCLSSDLCNIAEDLIVTQCFQRESIKDQVIIYLFLFATVGLVFYAFFRRRN